jgi:hypothetical protein
MIEINKLEDLKQVPQEQLNDTFFNLTKPCSAVSIGNQIIYAIEEGLIDAVKAGIILKRFEKIQKVVFDNKDAKKIIQNKTEEFMVNNVANTFGAVISLTSVHTSYDFKTSNHLELNELYAIQEYVQRRIGEIEEELKELHNETKSNRDSLPSLDMLNKFKFDAGGKEIHIKALPKLVFEDIEQVDESTGEVVIGQTIVVTPPKKFQKQGLKYNNL